MWFCHRIIPGHAARLGVVLAFLQICPLLSGSAPAASVATNQAALVTIDTVRRARPVSPYEYGMFIEPIGQLVAHSLWAEMLDDRKFYFPVMPEGKDPVQPLSVEGHQPVELRKWRPMGASGSVTMDRADPYVGAQSVAIALAGPGIHGIAQQGLTLTRGRAYTGHIVLSGKGVGKVSVALVWGDAPGERQEVALAPTGRAWVSLPFSLTCVADTTQARFEIRGEGEAGGVLRIGAVSLMPADNIDGWRADTITLAKSLHSGFWRMPGGNFLSDWDWHDAIGPRDKRPPMYDYAWSAMQTNDQGMDEWLNLARLVGSEPYLTVNAGLGDAHSAAEEVEYINGAITTPWGAKRAANGHKEPYGVKFWNIGNEPYGWWQIGRTTNDYFAIKHRDFAARMRAVDPSITLIASGAMPDQLHPRDVKENPSMESIAHKFGTDEDWTGGMFARTWGDFDGITEHWYDRAEERPDATPAQELLEFARQPSNHVRMIAQEWAVYQQRFPALKAGADGKPGIFLSIDEYAYQAGPPRLKTALSYGMIFNEMLRHTEFLRMAAFTSGASTMDVNPSTSVLNAVGTIFKLYGEHFGTGTIPVELTGDAPQPDLKFLPGSAHPQVRAGSSTWPLDMVAGLTPDGKRLRLAIVNATQQARRIVPSLGHQALATGDGRQWVLTGPNVEAQNRIGAAPQVSVTEKPVRLQGGALEVTPLSVTIFELPLAAR